MKGFEYTRFDEKGTQENLQLARALLIPRCWHQTASIYPMLCLLVLLFAMLFITVLSSTGMYSVWQPDKQVNDPDHVAWILRLENMNGLFLLVTLGMMIIAAFASPTDGTVTIEPYPPNFWLRTAWFMFVCSVCFSGAMMICYFAFLRFGATQQSFTEGNIAVQFTIVCILLIFGMQPLPYVAIVWPLGISTFVIIILYLIQSNDKYVIYAQFKSSHEGLLAGLIYLAIMIVWYEGVAFIFSYKKYTTWVRVETNEQQAKINRLRRELKEAQNGEDSLLIESLERRLQEAIEVQDIDQKFPVDSQHP